MVFSLRTTRPSVVNMKDLRLAHTIMQLIGKLCYKFQVSFSFILGTLTTWKEQGWGNWLYSGFKWAFFAVGVCGCYCCFLASTVLLWFLLSHTSHSNCSVQVFALPFVPEWAAYILWWDGYSEGLGCAFVLWSGDFRFSSHRNNWLPWARETHWRNNKGFGDRQTAAALI